MGLITVQERRREGQKNLPNVVRIVSRDWLQWITRKGTAGARPGSEPTGFKKRDPTDNKEGFRGVKAGTAETSRRSWRSSNEGRRQQ
jgi:hypothetical protein